MDTFGQEIILSIACTKSNLCKQITSLQLLLCLLVNCLSLPDMAFSLCFILRDPLQFTSFFFLFANLRQRTKNTVK